jgi:hypothetical protein
MKQQLPVLVLMACIAATVPMSSFAALHGRLPATEGGTDYQAYYDDVQNVTWVANGRLAASNTFGLPTGEWLGPHPDDSAGPEYSNGRIYASTGAMEYAAALHWLDAMNASAYLGFSGWRMPRTRQPDPSCSDQFQLREVLTRELLDLSYGYDCTGSEMGHLANFQGIRAHAPGPFTNVVSSSYWTGEFDANVYAIAWSMQMGTGAQLFGGKADRFYAWPVIDGDVGAPGPPDIDQDGIPDDLELALAHLGLDPCRKSIVVEIDYMDGSLTGFTHRPHEGLIPALVDAFDAAPIAAVSECPFDGFPTHPSGVNFVAYIDQEVPEQSGDFSPSTGLPELREVYFDESLLPWVHYAVFAHAIDDGSTVSGICCEQGSFIVSLGNWTLNSTSNPDSRVPFYDPDADQDARLVIEAGTFMHELGHALGFRHGGDESVNYKPNYLSVMNYSFQTRGLLNADDPANWILDYSRAALPSLDESALDESQAVCPDPDCPALLTTWLLVDAAGEDDRQFADTRAAIDWNGNGVIDAESVAQDVNSGNDAYCVGDGPDDVMQTIAQGDDVFAPPYITSGANGTCETTADPDSDDSQLAEPGTRPDIEHFGHDDWAAIRFLAAENAYGQGVASYEVRDVEEIAEQEAAALGAFWDRVQAELLAADGDRAPVISAPETVTLEANDSQGWLGDLAAGAGVAVQNPSGGDVSLVSDAPLILPLGTTVVNWVVTNELGLEARASQTIDVVDTTAPVLEIPDNILMVAHGPLSAVELGDAHADDVFPVSITNDAPDQFPVGVTRVQWVAEDSNGNRASATQEVNLRYAFGGFEPPLKGGGVFKRGQTLPVKFRISFSDGNPAADAAATFSIYMLSDGEVMGEALDAQSSSSADSGNQFRYSEQDGIYIFNLRMDFGGSGQYQIAVDPGDGSLHGVPFALK